MPRSGSPAAPPTARLSVHAIAVIAFLGLSSAWNAGNVGPVASELAREFDTTLVTIGVLTGTVFFAGNLVFLAVAARVAERIGVITALRIACICTALGNVVLAVTPGAAGLAIRRVR